MAYTEAAMAEQDHTFFDIHCHAMNLGHPNLLALLARLDHERNRLSDTIFGPYSSFFLHHPRMKFRNLLSVMENDTGSIFELVEDDLKGVFLRDDRLPLYRDGALHVDRYRYPRLVLTPLTVDFGLKEIQPLGTYYNRAPSKPIDDQIIEMLQGIQKYHGDRPDGPIEIYPFLGINPRNYSYEGLRALLDKYFGRYRPVRRVFHRMFSYLRRSRLTLSSIGAYAFLGIKLYPPLGFDPWPDDPEERRKAEYLYAFCQEKQIPITTHCSDAGFVVIPKREARKITSPFRWESVLWHYPHLRVNFAHFARQYSRKWLFFPDQAWREKLIELMLQYPNVYTDVAFNGAHMQFYRSLSKELANRSGDERDTLRSRILFGSDFMISLVDIESYFEYVERFAYAPLDAELKHSMCSLNPARFLFAQ
jgi:hypothetical protein